MAIDGYTTRKSFFPGEMIDFHVSNTAENKAVRLTLERVGARARLSSSFTFSAGAHDTPPDAYAVGCAWPSAFSLLVPEDFPSGVYVAKLENADGETENVRFVVRRRARDRDARLLVCLPFFTSQAYNDWGGKSLYPWDSPERARRVSFHRPGGTNPIEALPFVRWLEKNRIDADYCTSMDLHAEPHLLDPYQLFISPGHDEYWSKEMRDHVESFIAAGGNAAFLSGNTCYWQVRVEDEGRTLVCHRDAVEDPLSGIENDRVTVQWASAPVERPENEMTGVGYRFGAGYWLDPDGFKEAEYRVSFPEHWVFEGTGLRFGEVFARGAVGYETDAAPIEIVGGVARAIGRGGTPANLVVLAVADLRRFRAHGQGGLATMCLFRRGGTVFTAASVHWATALEVGSSPAVERVTQNVLDRLSRRYPERGWEPAGSAPRVVAMTNAENRLFAVTEDGALLWREPSGQNLPWSAAGEARGVVAMASPSEAVEELPVGLFLVTADGRLHFREPLPVEVVWTPIGPAPDIVAMTAASFRLFAASRDGALLARPIRGGDQPFQPIGRADGVVAMGTINGKIYAATRDGRLSWRRPVLVESEWVPMGETENIRALAGANGRLFAATQNGKLLHRDGF